MNMKQNPCHSLPAVCMRFSLMLGSLRTCSNVRSPLKNQFSAVLGPTPKTLLNNWATNTWTHTLTHTLAHPCWKNNICWLGMFWSMTAGLSWYLAGPKQLAPAQDQLRTSLNQQSCFKTYLTSICWFFNRDLPANLWSPERLTLPS